MTTRTRDPEAKRAAVLDVAVRMFTEHGFRDVSTATIAAEAGVSEGIVFHHYGSKHGLLEACAAATSRDFIAEELGARHVERIDAEQLVAATFDWVSTHQLIASLWAEADDRVIGSLRRGMQRSVVEHVAARLRDEQRAGRCRPGDPTLFARLQFGLVGEALVLHFAAPDRWPRQLVVTETARSVDAVTRP